MPFTLLPATDPLTLWAVILTGLVAGVVRGFSGFGAAMIFMPVASALIGPVPAIVVLWAIDVPFSLPLAVQGRRLATWREVLPLAATASAVLPFGVMLITRLDPVSVRWIISILILVSVAGLASGWRYRGRPTPALTLGIGALSGLSSGIAGIGGPPIVLFWLGGQAGAPRVRANLMAFFAITSMVTGVIFASRGLISAEILRFSAVTVVGYGLGILAGSRLFGLASETTFRRAAFALVSATALIGLPVIDFLFQR